MDHFQELDFIYRLYLRDAVKHPKGLNFKHDCPTGPDRKRRGYVLISPDKIVVYCHHCGYSHSLKHFIENSDPSLYMEYQELEKKSWKAKVETGKIAPQKKSELSLSTAPESGIPDLKVFKLNPKYFIPARNNDQCLAYCRKRKIPEYVIDTLKYATHPKHQWGGMLIFPLYWKDNEHVYGFQGRSICGDKRFYNFCKNESFKVYNIFKVDLTKPVYIFEAIIDSYSKTNSVAGLGTSLSAQVLAMIPQKVFCFDNDLRGDKKGLTQALKMAEQGESVLVWPKELDYFKDPNDLLVKGSWSAADIDLMILKNIKKGFGAATMLKLKMRGKR